MPLRRAALVPILLLALIAYLNAMCPDASGEGDPHLTFAHGGRADFRGKHGRLFNLLSAARLSINAMTEEGIFRMNEATVNGSWLTQFHALATTSAGLLQFSMFGFKISPASLLGWSNGTCAGRPFKLTGARLGHVLRDSPLHRGADLVLCEALVRIYGDGQRLTHPAHYDADALVTCLFEVDLTSSSSPAGVGRRELALIWRE